MKLVVGLGNPGSEYKGTRHNIGFYFLDKFAEEKNLKFKKQKKYLVAEYSGTYFIKPTTFMNLSGIAVTSFKTKYGFDDLLVLVDDVNLPLATIRVRESGGDGGHNGLKSIIKELGTDKFKRIRVGVGNPDINLTKYVLSKFNDEEIEKIEGIRPFISKLLEIYSKKDFKEVLDFNSKNYPILKNSLESKDQRREV